MKGVVKNINTPPRSVTPKNSEPIGRLRGRFNKGEKDRSKCGNMFSGNAPLGMAKVANEWFLVDMLRIYVFGECEQDVDSPAGILQRQQLQEAPDNKGTGNCCLLKSFMGKFL